MSARNQLLHAYEQWRLWTEAEGEAIQHAEWEKVAWFQHRKRELQNTIVQATEQADTEPSTEDPVAFKATVRSLVKELILLETRNASRLADQKQIASDRRTELGRNEMNLRRLRGSYTSGPTACWSSYS